MIVDLVNNLLDAFIPEYKYIVFKKTNLSVSEICYKKHIFKTDNELKQFIIANKSDDIIIFKTKDIIHYSINVELLNKESS